MKGADTITDTIIVIGAIILLIALAVAIVPNFLNFLKTTALNGSDLVTKELSELVTISAAAPNEIQITYNPSTLKYNLDITKRIVKTDLLRQASMDVGEIQETSLAKIAVDVTGSFGKVNVFDIKKTDSGIFIQAS